MVAAAAVLAGGACRFLQPPAGPVERPTARPAARALVAASVAVTLRAVVGTLDEEGLPVRRIRNDAGLVETDYFELNDGGAQPLRLAFSVEPDTLGRGAQLVAFALAPATDANGPAERALAPDHPAIAYLRKLIEEIERRVIGP